LTKEEKYDMKKEEKQLELFEKLEPRLLTDEEKEELTKQLSDTLRRTSWLEKRK
jgi:hypothetical protein